MEGGSSGGLGSSSRVATTTAPPASALNFTAGRTRANSALVSLGTGGAIGVQCDMASGTLTHLLVDVSGYFQ